MNQTAKSERMNRWSEEFEAYIKVPEYKEFMIQRGMHLLNAWYEILTHELMTNVFKKWYDLASVECATKFTTKDIVDYLLEEVHANIVGLQEVCINKGDKIAIENAYQGKGYEVVFNEEFSDKVDTIGALIVRNKK